MSDGSIDAAPLQNSPANQGTSGTVSKNPLRKFFKRKAETAIPDDASSFKKALKEGLLYGAVLFLLFAVWMAYRSNETAQRIQPLIPSKTASIEASQATSPDPNAPLPGLEQTKNIHALPPAPIEGLFEKYNGMMLPLTRIGDDLTPFQAYKKPYQTVAGKSQISIVIVDYGLSPQLSESMLANLSDDISLVLTPYAQDPAKWASAARAYGHEFWLSLPMQTKDFGLDDTGPWTLLLNSTAEENQKRLFDVMGAAVGYAGLVSQQGHAFEPTDKFVQPVMKQIFGRGLAFVESNPDIPAYGLSMAMEFGYPYAQNGAWLDADLRPEAIDAALQQLELQATRKGRAIAFIHPYPLVINKVQSWIAEAESRGIQMAPLSALVQ